MSLSMEELQEVFDEMRIGKVVNTMKKEKEKNMYLTKIIKNECFQTQYVPPVPEEEETDDSEGIH